MLRTIPWALVFTVFFFACDPFGSNGRVDSHFEATISGEFTAQIQGRSTLGTFIDPVTGLTATIIIMIPSPDNERGINISGLTVSRIEERSYPIIASLPGRPFEPINQDEFTASYTHDDAQYSKTFQSQIGTISISNSTDDVLQGSFSFEASGYRFINNENNERDTVEVSITIEGNFTSVRGELI